MKTTVVGAGINGVVAAIELRKRGHDVVLVDPGPLPHPLAASTDISKVVRAAYGADEEYTELAERSREIWQQWNVEFGVELYDEVGFLCMRQRPMQTGDFEYESLRLLERRGHRIERVNSDYLRRHFPAWNADRYPDGFLDFESGYAESGRAVAVLIEGARSIGVELREHAKFCALDEASDRVKGIVFESGEKLPADAVVMAVGAWTPYVLPFTHDFFRASGQPVFHLKPAQPELFAPERFPIFGADISATGFYGFPLNRDGVVKIANHGLGREMSPDSPERVVTKEEENRMREFLADSFPSLADAPVVFTRVCFYCDTKDGDFWIAPDPDRAGLTIATGDSGHGFKFAPVLGGIIADAVEGKVNPKFRWRPEVKPGVAKEAARFQGDL
ncbi:MAG TPA: FAD-dependent oxidoreductase [Chthoniobacterales bacterium]|jgi:glycine/D-amino acid oxidase-like deaminating enzyme|nr:FAD-dependent oxidoreductase [Chthoniobacterales bacterium]